MIKLVSEHVDSPRAVSTLTSHCIHCPLCATNTIGLLHMANHSDRSGSREQSRVEGILLEISILNPRFVQEYNLYTYMIKTGHGQRQISSRDSDLTLSYRMLY